MIRYLLDEHVEALYEIELPRREPSIIVRRVGASGAPPKRTEDPDLLRWCEEHGFILVTNNRRSMPVHLVEHLAQGRHIPGIFILNRKMSIGAIINDLLVVCTAGDETDYVDRMTYMPLI